MTSLSAWQFACPNLWSCSFSKFYRIDCFGTYVTHAQTCDHVRVQSATEWTASVHTWSWHMPKPVTTFVLKVLRNGLPRYILDTCPNMWSRSCSKCYGMDCLGTYLIMTHAQTCDHIRAQSATEWTAPVHTWHMPKHVITFVCKVLRNGLPRYILHVTHMPKPVITFVFKVLRNGLPGYILDTCRNLWFKVLRNGLPRYILDHDTCPNLWPHSCSKCYGMDCPGTYLTHAQTCDHVRLQSATEWTASVHTWSWHMPKPVTTFVLKVLRNGLPRYILNVTHMPKPVITFVFKVLRNGLPGYILDTCRNLWSRSCSMWTYTQTCDHICVESATEWIAWGSYLTTCDHARAQSATIWTAAVHTSNMPKPVIMFVFKFPLNGLPRYILDACPVPCSPSCSKCYGMSCPGTYWHMPKTCEHVRVQCHSMDCKFLTRSSRDTVRVEIALRNRPTASVNAWRMPKPLIPLVLKVLRSGLLR